MGLPKADGSAKARLVILGFQQPNLTEVQAAAPTMNRMSRNMLLMTCANSGFQIRSGDVTSAFLQTNKSLEDEELTVWATPELAVHNYAGAPKEPSTKLRVSKSFYGLVHAPRQWYDDVSRTLGGLGWRKLTSDGCLFTLWEIDELVGVAGIHVDDFLIGGKDDNEVFMKALKGPEDAYREPDNTIFIDQNEYSEQWMDEVQMTSERACQLKSPATAAEISQLRGVVGTFVIDEPSLPGRRRTYLV